MWAWLIEHWKTFGGAGTALALLAALPRIGGYVRGCLLESLYWFPPLSPIRYQVLKEQRRIEEERSLRYRHEMTVGTEEIERLTAERDALRVERDRLARELSHRSSKNSDDVFVDLPASAPPRRSKSTAIRPSSGTEKR